VPALGPNAYLIGQPDARARLCTPALLLDLEAFEHNLAAMAVFCREQGVALRPHAKTHKSVEIARKQLEAGAVGICCATIGEAERLTDGGIDNLLITSPLATAAKLERLAALLERANGLMVVADRLEAVDALAGLAAGASRPLAVLVDLGVGRQRTGCTSTGAALAVARRIAAANSLVFGGVQAYAGHLQHIPELAERQRQGALEDAKVREVLDGLAGDGIEVPRVTGAGTGSHAIDAARGLFNELQCGSYIFLDVDYMRVALRADGTEPFRPSLLVRTAVISANAEGHVTTDAGLKAFATDGPRPVIARGAPAGAEYFFFGDEHGRVELEDAPRRLPVGTALECLVPHCDPTVNLHNVYHVVQGDALIDIWPIDARGAI
jgi:D-serine deaminase-like pyridoxal phosphate-dependent protein